MGTHIGAAAVLVLIVLSGLSGTASARWQGDGHWHGDNRWRGHERTYGYYYRAPPVIYGRPYNYGYQPPPVIYGAEPGVNFNVNIP